MTTRDVKTESDGPPIGPDSSLHHEPHDESLASRLNWLRAGVLGANDGIISTAGLVVGVAGGTDDRSAILLAGLAGLVAGALSMAVGEYVSVSAQRDTESAMLALERRELRDEPEAELEELVEIYQGKGLAPQLAREVAIALTRHDALAAHADAELNIDPDDLTNPWAAAMASLVSFAIGAMLPLLTIVLTPTTERVPATFAAVLLALLVTGSVSARLGRAPVRRALVRNVGGGAIAMIVTYLIGTAFGSVL